MRSCHLPRSRHANRVASALAAALALAALAVGGDAGAQTLLPPGQSDDPSRFGIKPQPRPNGLRGPFDPAADDGADVRLDDSDRDERRRRSRTREEEENRRDRDDDKALDPARDAKAEGIVSDLEEPKDDDGVIEPPDPDAERDPDLVEPDEAAAVDALLAGDPEEREPGQPGPYDPLGVRVGSFLVFPELLLEGLFTDNALQSPDTPRSDTAFALAPALEFRSDWNRHLLEGEVRALTSSYAKFDNQNDESFLSSLRGRIDVTRKTNIETRAAYERTLEELSSEETPTGAAERTPIKAARASVQLSHRFNRLTASLRGAIDDYDYDNVRLINGGIANNNDRDYLQQQLVGRLSHELRPGVAAFVEGTGNVRDYASAFDDNGLRRDSTGYTVVAGITLDFGKITGELAAGFARQTPEDLRLEDVEGLIFNAALVWQATALTKVSLRANSTIDETTAVDSAASLRRSVELAVEHAFRPHLIAGVALGYEHEDFTQSGQVDQDYIVGVTGEYRLSRAVALVGRYEWAKSTSTAPDRDYVENQFRLGVRLRR